MPQNNKPLTKKDFWAGLGEFFEKVLAPYLEKHVEKRLDEHDKRFDRVEERLDGVEGQLISMDRKLDLVAEKVTIQEKTVSAHNTRLSRLEETIVAAK